MLFLLATAMACVNHDSENVPRRACAFGSYQLFRIHVQKAMATLGCDSDCNGCHLNSLSDCAQLSVLAAYTEEAGDDALSRLTQSAAQCIVPEGDVSLASITSSIVRQPSLVCEGDPDVRHETWVTSVAAAALSTLILTITVRPPTDYTQLVLN